MGRRCVTEISNAHATPNYCLLLCPPLLDKDVSSHLRHHLHACLPSAILHPMMIMEFKSLETEFQNVLFHRLPWSRPLFKGTENSLRQQLLQNIYNIKSACLHLMTSSSISKMIYLKIGHLKLLKSVLWRMHTLPEGILESMFRISHYVHWIFLRKIRITYFL